MAGIKRWTIQAPVECLKNAGIIGNLFGPFRQLCTDQQMIVDIYPGDLLSLNADIWDHKTEIIEGPSISVTGEYVPNRP